MAVDEQLEEITDSALSRAWPGRTGARNFRIQCAIIRRVSLNGNGSLKIKTDLPSLAYDAGLAYSGTRFHEALSQLIEAGWIKWEIGQGSYHVEDRQPSEIELLPRMSSGRFSVRRLPDPRLSLYAKEDGGSSAYLLVARVIKDDHASYSNRDLAELTGLSLSTIERKMKKLLFHFRKIDGRWVQDDLESACEHGVYDEGKWQERTTRLILDRRASGAQPTTEALWIPSSQSVADPISPLPPTEPNRTPDAEQVPESEHNGRFNIDELRSRIPPWERERLLMAEPS